MSDKWMEMERPMLLMQSHNINTISLVVFGYSLEIFYTRGTRARGRMRKVSLRSHYPLYLRSRRPTEGEGWMQSKPASGRPRPREKPGVPSPIVWAPDSWALCTSIPEKLAWVFLVDASYLLNLSLFRMGILPTVSIILKNQIIAKNFKSSIC